MARPLRIQIPGGRYHLTARGNERRAIFRDERDREHFLELLGELPERFGVLLHAYVLMRCHFHLLLETPEANLSRTAQWLNVSYSVWFNRRRQRSGHLFQGRFGAVIIEEEGALAQVGRYLHLNPVRVGALRLSKAEQAARKAGLLPAPSAELVAARLKALRQYKWSSYPAYAGYARAPEWLSLELLGKLWGGRSRKERQRAVRKHTEEAIREGMPASPWERLTGGVVLGSEAFAQRLCQGLKGNARKQPGMRRLGRSVSWERIVRAVESIKGEEWESFRDRHGDWGRDVALWLGRREGRLTLAELAELAGGLHYTAAGTAVSRLGKRLSANKKLSRIVARCRTQLSNVEM